MKVKGLTMNTKKKEIMSGCDKVAGLHHAVCVRTKLCKMQIPINHKWVHK